jgi:hypothetical protein
VAVAGALVAAAPGCYVGARAGAVVHTAADRDFESVGWMVAVNAGVELTLFDLVRLGLGYDADAGFQPTPGGFTGARHQGPALKADVTVWQRRTWRRDVAGCPRQHGGWRMRAGVGVRSSGAAQPGGVSVHPDGAEQVKVQTNGFTAWDATVEVGGWRHNGSVFAGLGTSYASLDVEGGAPIESYAAFAQLTFSSAGPLRSATVLFSNYGAIEAERQRWAWSTLDCNQFSDRAECERTRTEQLAAWSGRVASEEQRAIRQRADARCL